MALDPSVPELPNQNAYVCIVNHNIMHMLLWYTQ